MKKSPRTPKTPKEEYIDSPSKKRIDTGPRGTQKDSLTVRLNESKLEFYDQYDKKLSTTPVKSKDNEERKVNHAQMMDRGRNILLLTPEKRNLIIRMDTEYQKQLDEMEFKYMRKNLDLPLDVVVPLHKFAPIQSQQSVFDLAGIGGKDNRTIFAMTYDPRVPDPVVIKKDSSKQYKSGPEFTSICTTQDGFLVTGDAHGCVRIYRDPSESATYKLDQLQGVSANIDENPKGDPVIGCDVTANREWVIWTTPTFVAIVHFDMQESDPWNIKSTTKKEKPRAMLLKITPSHLENYKIDKVNFLPAKFDVGPSQDLNNKDIMETYIVTFTGQYRVMWNMRHVKRDYFEGKTESYGTITLIKDHVLDHVPDYGRPGSDDSVISLEEGVRHLKF